MNLQTEVYVGEQEDLDDVDGTNSLFEEHHTLLSQQLEIVYIGGLQQVHHVVVVYLTLDVEGVYELELFNRLKKPSDQTLYSIVKHRMKIDFYLKIDSFKLVADPYT